MRVSYRWLQELLPGLDAPPGEVADRLTNAGLEVEAVEDFGAGLNAVVLASIRKVEPHPKREQLKLVTVDRGAGQEQQVVCGAPNVPGLGKLAVLAPLGARLPAVGLTVESRRIGGQLSEGMLCSEAELGLGDDEAGILVLPEAAAQPGTPLPRALEAASDSIFEIAVTPNRADALGHLGVARDLAALYQLDLFVPEPGRPQRSSELSLDGLVSVDNQDPERCPHYGAAVAVEVAVAPSPPWLRWRLYSLGIRPISNVVDITNLLLLESGHPMHAFDLDRVRERRVIIRRARAREPFTTLDGVTRTLEADDLVICDGQGPTALAGVMGGQDSEIRDETRRVLLECAYFAPRGIRRTARRHALQTDSSYRFERGVDWAAVPRVLERAKVLLTELAGAAAVPGAIHARPVRPELPRLRLRERRLSAILGTQVALSEATDTLARLGLEVGAAQEQGDDVAAEVHGASWRPDLKREIDLIEEVARVRGLDSIPTVLPRVAVRPPRPTGRLERQLSDIATGLGLSEAVTYAFVSRRELELLRAPPAVVTLSNPLSEERSVMRTSLLPGLLDALRRAWRHGERSVRLFTVGSLFLGPETAQRVEQPQAARPRLSTDAGVLPEERPAFAAVLAGLRPAYLERQQMDVYDAKGIAVELVERVTGRQAHVRSASANSAAAHLHPRGAAEILVDAVWVGVFGPLHPAVVEALELDGSVLVIELDLVALETVQPHTPTFRPVPRLPAIARDISLEVSEQVPAETLQRAIQQAAEPLCESVALLDVFSGAPIARGYRSLTFRVVYRDPKASTDPEQARTLTDQEVDACHVQVRVAVERLGARPRV
jgi:phenylalanyl-tRNA synthetase beta chain